MGAMSLAPKAVHPPWGSAPGGLCSLSIPQLPSQSPRGQCPCSPGDSPSVQEGLLDREGSEGSRGRQLCPQVLGCTANFVQMDRW